MNSYERFDEAGFLSTEIGAARTKFRAENEDWFQLVDELNSVLMRTAAFAVEKAKTSSMAREAVATRILLRACGTLQGAILMAERGMTAQARTLARSLIEDAFCVAALEYSPDEFLKMLKDDSDASRRLQGKFIQAKELIETGAVRDRLICAIEVLGKPDIMSPKKVAELGPLTWQYLVYQRLSDDAAHTSARSLHRHIYKNKDSNSWIYRWGPATIQENAATLHHVVLGALPIGVGITQMLGDEKTNQMLDKISDRFFAMPKVDVI